MPSAPPTTTTLLHYLRMHCMGLPAAMTAADLAAVFDVRPVLIRELVHKLRLHGVIIGSSSTGTDRGYYIPSNRQEALLGIDHLVSRVRSVAEVYEAQKAAIENQFGVQPSLFDVAV